MLDNNIISLTSIVFFCLFIYIILSNIYDRKDIKCEPKK